MKQEVLITLRGTQAYGDDKPETVELVTRGTMTGRNGKFAISYEETELTGTPGATSTFLVFNPQRVILTRVGTLESRIVFEEGLSHESLYNLGFGSFLIGIHTKKVAVDLTEEGGTLEIDYTVELEQSVSSRNSYVLTIEPLPKAE